MPKQALTVTTFQYADGTPVANGTFNIRLSKPGSVNNTQLQNSSTKISLDASGVVTGSPTFWPNASISPSDTYYIVSIYNSNGLLVSGPSKLTI